MAERVDAAIAAIAARQHGNITHEQLRAAGLGVKAIAYRCHVKRLFREHRCVYAVGKPAQTPLERAAAAVLACGDGAALSHHAALALWEFVQRWPAILEVITPRNVRPPGIRAHQCRTLHPRDLTTQHGIRVTHPARAMLDVARGYPPHRLPRLVNGALHTLYLTRGQLTEACARHPTHRGTRLLLPFCDASAGNPTRSGWEDDLPAWCARHGVPIPLLSQVVAGRELDGWYPQERVAIELDSWEFHNDREAFRRDRLRDAEHLALDIVTVRITWDRQYGDAPADEAERLRRILAVRRNGGRDEHRDGHRDEHRDGHRDEHRDGHRDEHRDGHRDEHRDGHRDEHRDGHRDEHRDGHRDEHRDGGRDERRDGRPRAA